VSGVENGISRRFILCCGCCLLLGAGGGIGIGWGIWGRPLAESAGLAERYDELAGRNRQIVGELGDLARECEVALDTARADNQRIAEQSGRARANLQIAIGILTEVIESKKGLEDSIGRVNSRLLDLRGDNRVEDNEVAE
jgi:hypothetical protein